MKRGRLRKRSFAGLAGIIMVMAIVGGAYALPGYLNQFTAQYATSGTALSTCLVCHAGYPARSPSVSTLNPYGNDFLNAGYDFVAIEGLDSDGDGYTNIVEINARTFPGDPASYPAPTPPPPATDTTPPTITAFAIPGSATTLTVAITTFTASDNAGVTGYMLTEVATAPAATATGWSATAPTSYTFTSAGAKTLYAWAKDAAGNVSASLSAAVTVTVTAAASSPPDILWQHQISGAINVWLMNGTSFTSGAPLGPGVVSDTNWKIVGVTTLNTASSGGTGGTGGGTNGTGGTGGGTGGTGGTPRHHERD